MKALVFVEPGQIELRDKPIPDIGPNDALVRITTTTICGTDVHIVKGEYPVASGLTIGHEPVGVIEKLGSNVQGYTEGQRVIAGERLDLKPIVTHRFRLDDIVEAYELSAEQRDGVLKVAVTP